MNLGIAKRIITPPVGTPLAGFAFRDHGSEGVLDDLEVHALWFESDDAPGDAVCIVTADVVGFDAPLTTNLRASVAHAHGIAPERILLAASHTHSGPQTCSNLIGVGAIVPEVMAMLHQRIMDAVDQARANRQHVTLRVGRAKCEGYAINRRPLHDGKAAFAPNPGGVRDDEVTVIACHDAVHDEPLAVLFHFTCHPSTMRDYLVSADYAGAARRHIEKALRGALAAFLPGCFGDVRSNCTLIGGREFRKGLPEDLAAFGAALGEAVLQAMRESSQTLTPALGGRMLTLDLPLAHHPERDELERTARDGNRYTQEWATRLLAAPMSPTRPLSLQRIDLARELSIIAMGGEICCDYGYFIKHLDASRCLIPVGYSNGLVGYIPSARMFPEGGYEVVDSTLYFGLPSPFDPGIEATIQAGIRELMRA